MMTDGELRDAALAKLDEELANLKQTTRGLKGFSPPASSAWGKGLKARDDAIALIKQVGGTQPPPPPPPTGTPLVFHNPDSTGNLTPWTRIESGQPGGVTENPYVSSVPNGITWSAGGPHYSNVRVVDDPLGQRGKVYELTTTADSKFKTGSGDVFERCDLWQHNGVAWNVEGSEIWENVKIMFPNSWNPLSGYYNWVYQHHDGAISVPGTGIVIGMTSEDPSRFFLRVPGGNVNDSTQFTTRTYTSSPVQRNRWYALELHILWSKTAGFCEFFSDSTSVFRTDQPTLGYNGATVDNPNYQLSNYHEGLGQNSTVYFDGPRIARTRTDAQF